MDDSSGLKLSGGMTTLPAFLAAVLALKPRSTPSQANRSDRARTEVVLALREPRRSWNLLDLIAGDANDCAVGGLRVVARLVLRGWM